MSEIWLFALVGLTTGGAYALTAVGIVTVFRGSGVLNLAHGGIGMWGTYVFWETYRGGERAPLPIAIALGLLSGAALGVLVYLAVMRPLLRSTDLARLVASLGVLLVLQGLALLRYGPVPSRVPRFLTTGSMDVFGGRVSYDSLVVLVITIVLAIGLSLLFRRTRLGYAATALSERPDAAAAIGISPHPTGITVWAIGSALATAAGILLVPVLQLSPTQLTSLTFPAFAAALFGRFRNYVTTIVSAVAIGMFASVLLGRGWPTSVVRAVPFMFLLVGLIIGGSTIPGRAFVEGRLPRLGDGRVRWRWVAIVVAAVAFRVFTQPTGFSIAIVTTLIVALLTLSIVVATGYAGQINLAPFAIAGLGSLVSARLADSAGIGFIPTLAAAAVVGAVAGAIIGAPSIRVRGLDLAVATLGFALLIEHAVLSYEPFTRGLLGIPVPEPSLFGWSVSASTHPKRFAITVLLLVGLMYLLVAGIRRGPIGRRLVSVRENERGAASLGISVAGSKIAAFAIAGALAGLAGGVSNYRLYVATFQNFELSRSIIALGFTTFGGVGLLTGGLFAATAAPGAFFAYVLRNVVHGSIDLWLQVIAGACMAAIMIFNPDGEMDRLAKGGRMLKAAVTKRRAAPDEGIAPMSTEHAANVSPVPPETARPSADHSPPTATLRAEGLTVRYGGVVALNDVTFSIAPGEIVGVLGPNGAGKTTLIDGLTGFCPLTSGVVTIGGRDVTAASPPRRSRSGLARTFQNLELFNELTVRENIQVACDPHGLAHVLRESVRFGARPLDPIADRVVSLFGLEWALSRKVSSLPQGTQRLVALARAIATDPAVVLLDEPTAGLTSAERAAAATAITTLVRELGVGVLIVEHNVDVISALCQRVIVLEFGVIIAQGPTAEVLASDAVRIAYLGESAAGNEVPRVSTVGPVTEGSR